MTTFRSCLAGLALIVALVLPMRAMAQGTLFVEGSNVGIGTETPAVPLHVQNSTGSDTTMYRLENNGGNRFDFVNTLATFGGWWQFVNTSGSGGADLVIRELTKNISEEFRLTESGDLTISGELVTGGVTCGDGCDLVFDSGYELPSISEHAAAMWEKGHLPAVGPTKEGEPFNLTRKTGGILNELEVAHIYIEKLHSQIQELNERLARLEAKLSD